MTDSGLPALLHEPVWYEPLREPSWLLPPVREGAPRVVCTPAEEPASDDIAERALHLGLPLMVAEAIRFATDARVSATTGPWAVTDGAAAVVTVSVTGEGPGRELRVQLSGADGIEVDGFAHPVPDDDSLGASAAGLVGEVNGALRRVGVRAVWSTVYTPPAAATAVAYLRGHYLVARLRDPEVHEAAADDPEATSGRRQAVRSALGALADLASHASSPLAVALFFAGLAATKAAGSAAYKDFRLPANALAMGADDPRDPVARLSVLALYLFGDQMAAEQRVRMLGVLGDQELHAWLLRARAVG